MRLLPLALIAVLGVGACSTSGSGESATTPPPSPTTSATHTRTPRPPATTAPPASSAPASSPSSSPSSSPAPQSAAQRVLSRMSEAERVGQLIMVDCPSSGVADATISAIGQQHVGSVILDGNSTLGVDGTAAISRQLQALALKHRKLFISTDQEGGLVQRMKGPGFTAIPSAVTQGGQSAAELRSASASWGRELRAAGINLDLAPVLDTVPSDSAGNPPIGDLDREYGHTPSAVRRHGLAVAQGLADAGIDATVKHFPGLGRVSGNTDTTSGVTDDQTTRDDAYLAPFAAAVKRHVPFVMMSTAIYSRIDPDHPAAFSPTIVTGLLRDELGFTGVIISDDIGNAAQVRSYSPGDRAVQFVRAGGSIALTVDPSVVPAMTEALLVQAKNPAFKRKIDAAALVVLQAKQRLGLLD